MIVVSISGYQLRYVFANERKTQNFLRKYYWAYVNVDGIPTNGAVKSFTTNPPDISGTWSCTEYLSDGSVYETFTVSLNSDGSAEATENYGMFSGISHGSWSIGPGGHVGVSLIYYSMGTQWAEKNINGVVDNLYIRRLTAS